MSNFNATEAERALTDEQCDEFRRHRGTFNDMVRAIYAAGQAARAIPLAAADASDQAPDEVLMDRQYLAGYDAGFMAGERGDNAARNQVHAARGREISAVLAARPAPVDEAPAAEPVRFKDHNIRQLVNDLRDIALKFHATGQLRDRLSGAVQQFLKTPAAPDRAPSTQPAHEGIVCEGATLVCTACGTTSQAMSEPGATMPGTFTNVDDLFTAIGIPDCAPSTDSATERDAAQRLLKAASVYAFNYCQDEAEDEEDCVCGAKQHAEAKELFAAIAAMKGEG